MTSLPYPDLLYLEAARGWYLLGDVRESEAELLHIRAAFQSHPDMLEVKFSIAAKRKNWIECMELAAMLLEAAPDRATSWINCAFTLHELKQTQDAWNALYTVQDRFPDVATIPYNLACYACQLGRLTDSRQWLQRALKMGGKEFKRMAMEDADLQPLWQEIKEFDAPKAKG